MMRRSFTSLASFAYLQYVKEQSGRYPGVSNTDRMKAIGKAFQLLTDKQKSSLASRAKSNDWMVKIHYPTALKKTIDEAANSLKAFVVASGNHKISHETIDKIIRGIRLNKRVSIRIMSKGSDGSPVGPPKPFAMWIKMNKGREDFVGKKNTDRFNVLAAEYKQMKAAGTLPQKVVDCMVKQK